MAQRLELIKWSALIFPIALIVVVLSGCGPAKNLVEELVQSGCGDGETYVSSFSNYNTAGSKFIMASLGDMVDGKANFVLIDGVWTKGVCTREHVRVSASLILDDIDLETEEKVIRPGLATVWGIVEITPLLESRFPMSFQGCQRSESKPTSSCQFSGQHPGVGLKQAFGDGPGMFTMRIQVAYPSAGNWQRDLELMEGLRFTGTIDARYREHKQ